MNALNQWSSGEWGAEIEGPQWTADRDLIIRVQHTDGRVKEAHMIRIEYHRNYLFMAVELWAKAITDISKQLGAILPFGCDLLMFYGSDIEN